MSIVDITYLCMFQCLYFVYVPKNLLALGSEDKSLSISNADGDTIKQVDIDSHYNIYYNYVAVL